MSHRQEYRKTHKTVTSSWDELKDFFDAYTATDKTSGKFQDLQKQREQNVASAECKAYAANNSDNNRCYNKPCERTNYSCPNDRCENLNGETFSQQQLQPASSRL